MRAGDGNRTHISSLEGWCSTTELHLHLPCFCNSKVHITQYKTCCQANFIKFLTAFYQICGSIHARMAAGYFPYEKVREDYLSIPVLALIPSSRGWATETSSVQ